MPWLLLSFAPALAHPGGHGSGKADPLGGLPGQRVEARVEPGHVRLDYYVEIAAVRLYKEARAEGARDPGWAARKVESLRPGLRARWNDTELPLAALSVEVPAQAREGDFVELHLAAEAPLPAEPGTLELRMDNFAGEAGYYAASVELSGELVVTASNLARVHEGRLRDNLHGAWRTGEPARVASMSLRPARFYEGGAAGPLPERLEGLVPVALGWAVAAGAAAAAALGGAGWAAWRRRRRGG